MGEISGASDDAAMPKSPKRRRRSATQVTNDRSDVLRPLFVPYHRVSTKRQGASGLGLDAQERMIAGHIENVGGKSLPSFTEIETGKRADRPQLRKALALARQKKATLIVAKLDRLARNVHFVTSLQEAKVKFIAADFPAANEFMIQILAAVAQYEAKMISDRTKQALAERRRRQLVKDPKFKLGTQKNLQPGRSTAPQLNKAKALATAERLRPIVAHIRKEGMTSISGICAALNERGDVTGRGGLWYPTTVQRLLKRLDAR